MTANAPRPMSKHLQRALKFRLDLFWAGAGDTWYLLATTVLNENGNHRHRCLATVHGLRAVIELTRRVWAAGGRPDLTNLGDFWQHFNNHHGYPTIEAALAAWRGLCADHHRQPRIMGAPDYLGYSEACKADKETKAQRARREAEATGYLS